MAATVPQRVRAPRLEARAWLRTVGRPGPERWIWAVVAAGWVVLVVNATGWRPFGGAPATSMGEMPGMSPGMSMDHGTDAGPWAPLGHHLLLWVAMVAATMLPLVAGNLRSVGLRSPRGLRTRATVHVAAGWALVWLAAGLVITPAVLLGMATRPHGAPRRGHLRGRPRVAAHPGQAGRGRALPPHLRTATRSGRGAGVPTLRRDPRPRLPAHLLAEHGADDVGGARAAGDRPVGLALLARHPAPAQPARRRYERARAARRGGPGARHRGSDGPARSRWSRRSRSDRHETPSLVEEVAQRPSETPRWSRRSRSDRRDPLAGRGGRAATVTTR